MIDEMDRKCSKTQSVVEKAREKSDTKRSNYKKRDAKCKSTLAPPQKYVGRTTSIEKRPYSRGQGNRLASQKVNEDIDEFGSIYNTGSKKMQNMNHLLNFDYGPRPTRQEVGSRVGYIRSGYRRGKATGLKGQQQYLQANCQFVVRDDKDYTVNIADADSLVDWSRIEQVRLLSHEVPSCPICLYPPTAAKITKCGHIYCWPCMLHYMSLTDHSSCPICEQNIETKDLKSVLSIELPIYGVNDLISLTLMCREKGTTLARPITANKTNELLNMNAPSATQFSRLLVATTQQIAEIHAQNKQALLALSIDEDKSSDLEQSYVKLALDLLQKQESTLDLSELRHALSVDNSPTDENKNCSSACDVTASTGLMHNDSQNGATAVTREDTNNMIYYYQASDGQQIYLHRMNQDCLLHEYGTFNNCPPTLTARIVQKDDQNVRYDHRPQYLGHLAHGSPYSFVEIEITNLVSKQTFDHFKDKFDRRQRLRQNKKRQERRREKQQDRKNKVAEMDVSIDSAYHFPSCDPSCAEDVNPFELGPPLGGVAQEDGISPMASGSSLGQKEKFQAAGGYIDGNVQQMHKVLQAGERIRTESESTTLSNASSDYMLQDDNSWLKPGPSFAQLMHDGKSFPEINQSMLNNCRRAPVTSKVPSGSFRDASSTHTGSDDEQSVVPQFQQSFSSAIQQALDDYGKDSSQQTAVESSKSTPRSNKKKKNKKQQCVLFSTSMARH